jgi:DNA-3-methyladenine glycosylase II
VARLADSTDNDKTTQTRELTTVPPYDFPMALEYLRTWTAATFESIDAETGTYRRALRVNGQDVLLTLRSTGTVRAPRLLLEVRSDREVVLPATADQAAEIIRRILSLDIDPAEFHALADTDPALGPIVAPYVGMRPVLIPDLYETLVWAVLGQQINVAFARTLKLRMIELAGRELEIDGVRYPLMPLPDVVAALDPAELLARQYSRQKASYLIGLSQAVAGGDLDLEAIRTMSQDDAIAELTRQRGIGRWTAEYVLMRGVGDRDAIPAGDVSLHLLVGGAAIGRRVTEPELREIAERWRPWRGWVMFFVWMAHQFGRLP